jgi:hypothetical protein
MLARQRTFGFQHRLVKSAQKWPTALNYSI